MAKIDFVTSPSNSLLKEVRRAVFRGEATREGLLVAESFHLLEEALRSSCSIPTVIAAEAVRGEVENKIESHPGLRLVVVPDSLFRSISGTEASQGVIALVRPSESRFERMLEENPLIVILDGVQDPGNAGAILRAAEGFKGTGAVFLKGSADPFNPKAIRASAGSVFRLPLIKTRDEAGLLETLKRNDLVLYAANPAAGMTPAEADLRRPCAFLIGSEGRGIRPELTRSATPLRIPAVDVESLNAAMAAGILLYEARRQRMTSINVPAQPNI